MQTKNSRTTSLLMALLLITSALLVAPNAFAADGPVEVPIQGLLTDTEGTPLDGGIPVTFRIYADGTSNEVLWDESKVIPVDQGLFTAYLGTDTPLDSSIFHAEPGATLTLQIEGDEESARIDLGFAPLAAYSLTAGTADDALTLQGQTPDDLKATSAADIMVNDPQGGLGATNTQDALLALLQRVEALEASKTSLENRLATLENNNTAQDITDLQSRVGSLETTVSGVNSSISTNTSAITALSSRVNTTESDISSLQSTASSHASTLTSHTTTLANHDTTLNNHAATLTSHATTLNTHATTLTSHDTRLGDVETDNSAQDNRLAALETKTASMEAQTVNGQASVVFSDVNVHIRSGSGSTTGAVNGRGNLVVGYDEARTSGSAKTGSHNLVLGTSNNYTSFGGIVGGSSNAITNNYASVISGANNTASGSRSVIVTGDFNEATGTYSSIVTGSSNDATGTGSVAISGSQNISSGGDSVVVTGSSNEATSTTSVIVNGFDNLSDGFRSTVGGGTTEIESRSYGFTADGLVSP